MYRSQEVIEAKRYWHRRDTIETFEKRVVQQRDRLARLWAIGKEVGMDEQALEAAREHQLSSCAGPKPSVKSMKLS
jgi:hypothetical protein